MTKKKMTESRLLHGGDYNPDQWLNYPHILQDDLRLMELSKTNTFTLGVFAWSALEPKEGEFHFEWLDERMDAIHKMGGRVILATPSGARPAWMSEKYPEVLRTAENRMKLLHGGRHNHCFSSPIYREKVAIINRKLAERYGNHPALLMWHISNEYGGDCHCNLCQANFRAWLKEKYETLDHLNHSWWGPFWSHTITEWSQIESPSSLGENMVHGLTLDWKRFVTDQTINFYQHEIIPLREMTPDIPITTNFMADTHDLIPFQSLNYSKFAKHVDILSWDCYPAWHNDWEETKDLATKVGFINDLYRSLKQQPFLIMECTPSGVNWHDVNKTKRPGMHLLSSLQFIAHGSDSVLYFQWRKSRGSSEKFHGAVVDHDNSENNRVFKEVSAVGDALEKMKEIKDTNKNAKIAILYDWESNWAINDTQGFARASKQYPQTLQKHYSSFWSMDVSVDIITPGQNLDKYELVIAPMLYLMSEETIDKLEMYVSNGGTLVSSYITGLVNETDLAYLSGWHTKLQNIFGIDIKETDTLYPLDRNRLKYNDKEYEIIDYCTIIDNKSAQVLGTYGDDFYQGCPAVVVNSYGNGKAYYLGARTEQAFLDDFYHELIESLDLPRSKVIVHEQGVSVQLRESETHQYYFVMNFTEKMQTIEVKESMYDLLSQQNVSGMIEIPVYGAMVFKREV